MSYYSGMTFLTDWYKSNAAMAAKKMLIQAADSSTISKATRRRLNRAGISDKHLAEIKASLYTDGKFTGYDRNKLSQELLETLDRAQNEIAYNSVLHPDGFNMPRILSAGDDKLTRTLNNSVAKFMRFPLASYEALVLNGMATMDAQQAIGLALQAGMWSQILLAKDRLNNWGANSDNKRYNLEDQEGQLKLLQDTLMALSVTGGLTTPLNFVSSVMTGENLNGYSNNLGGSTIRDMQGLYNRSLSSSLYLIKVNKTLENLYILNKTTEIQGFKHHYELNLGD